MEITFLPEPPAYFPAYHLKLVNTLSSLPSEECGHFPYETSL